MPKLSGVFDQFRDIERIPPEDINRWLKVKLEPHILENYIANRILYPQTVPTSEYELDIDLAILREIIRRGSPLFYQNSRIVIPSEYVDRFPSLLKLATAFVDGLTPAGVTPIAIKEHDGVQLIGSYVSFSFLKEQNPIKVIVNGVEYKIKLNALTLLPFNEKQLKVMIDETQEILIDGGTLGVLIDLRPVKRGK